MARIRILTLAVFVTLVGFHASNAEAEWTRGGVRVGFPAGGQLEPQRIQTIADDQDGVWAFWAAAEGAPLQVQHLLADGTRAQGFPADGLPVSTITTWDHPFKAVPDDRGGFFVPHLQEFIRHMNSDGSLTPLSAEMGPASQIGSDGVGGVIGIWGAVGENLYAIHVSADDSLLYSTTPVLSDNFITGALDVIPDTSGGAFVLWEDRILAGPDTTFELRVVRLGADGLVQPGFPVKGHWLYNRSDRPAYLGGYPDGEGGIVIAWMSPGPPSIPGTRTLSVQRMRSDGTLAPAWNPGGNPAATGIEILMRSRPQSQWWIDTAYDGAQGMYLVWGNDGPAYLAHILGNGTIAPGFDPNGSPCTTSRALFPRIAQDGSAGAWVTWWEISNAPSAEVFTTHVSPNDPLSPGWPAEGVMVVGNGHYRAATGIVASPRGGATVFWFDTLPADYGVTEFADLVAARVAPDGTTAARPALVSSIREADGIHLEWEAREIAGSLIVERDASDIGWSELDRVLTDGSGRVAYVDRAPPPAGRVGYRLVWTDALGVAQATDPTWIELTWPALRLDGFAPNPAHVGATIAFALPGRAEAVFDVFDIAGRRVLGKRFENPDAGEHRVSFGDDAKLAPGVYLLRLRQAGQTRFARGVLLP